MRLALSTRPMTQSPQMQNRLHAILKNRTLNDLDRGRALHTFGNGFRFRIQRYTPEHAPARALPLSPPSMMIIILSPSGDRFSIVHFPVLGYYNSAYYTCQIAYVNKHIDMIFCHVFEEFGDYFVQNSSDCLQFLQCCSAMGRRSRTMRSVAFPRFNANDERGRVAAGSDNARECGVHKLADFVILQR